MQLPHHYSYHCNDSISLSETWQNYYLPSKNWAASESNLLFNQPCLPDRNLSLSAYMYLTFYYCPILWPSLILGVQSLIRICQMFCPFSKFTKIQISLSLALLSPLPFLLCSHTHKFLLLLVGWNSSYIAPRLFVFCNLQSQGYTQTVVFFCSYSAASISCGYILCIWSVFN